MGCGFNDRITVPSRINESKRFSLVVCGMFSALATGAIYAFSLISGKMTDDYNFSQNDITTISTVGIVFGYFTLPFGFIYDYFGPKPIFIIGIVAYAVGSLLFALTFEGKIGHSVVSLSVINAIMNIGCSMFDMGSVLSILSWFPLDRGLLIASTKTMTGLAGSVIATVYNTYFSGKHSAYMYFLLAVVVVIGTVCFVVIHIPPFHLTGYRMKHYTDEENLLARRVEHMYLMKKAPRRRFLILFIIVICMLIVISTQSIVFVFDDDVPFSKRNPPAILMIILYFSLFTAVIPSKWLDSPHLLCSSREDRATSEHPNTVESDDTFGGRRESGLEIPQTTADNEVTKTGEEEEETILHNDDRNFPQYKTGFLYNCLHNIPLWCVWLNAVIVAGGVHIVLLNSRQIFVAVSEDPFDEQRPSLYVALTSVGNAMGRMLLSFYEAWNASRPLEQRTPITVTYCIPSLLMALSSIFFLIVPTGALILPMMLGGLANGTYAAALVLTVRTIYSVDVAKHYNSIFFFDLIGVVAFNRFLFGETMTKNSVTGADGEIRCLGRAACIRTTFIVMACLSVFSFSGSVLLHIVYKRFVRKTWAEKSDRTSSVERSDSNELEEYTSKEPTQ